jgi:UDP-N-acetylmuramyl tripeptide synthase
MVRLDELRRAAASEGAVEVVLARRAAIEHAIGAASPGDVVAVLGLGALGRQVLDAAGTIAPHDDREAAREILARMGQRAWS